MPQIATPYTTTFAALLPTVDGAAARASTGRHVSVFAAADGTLQYSTSPDGVTWDAATALTGLTTTNLSAIGWHDDTLFLWYRGATITLVVLPMDVGANSFPTQQPYTYSAGAGSTGFTALDAYWDGTRWQVVVAYTTGTSNQGLGVFHTPGNGSVTSSMDLGYNHIGVQSLQVRPGPSGFVSIAFYDPWRSALRLLPVVFDGTAYTWNNQTTETLPAMPGMTGYFALVPEADGSAAFIINFGGPLYYTRHTAALQYVPYVPLNAQIVDASLPRVLRDAFTGDWYVVYESTAGRATGEIYVSRRQSGGWSPATTLVGGDGAGYHAPIAGRVFSTGVADALYTRGAMPAAAVDATTVQESSAPGAPTILAPLGDITDLTPAIRWAYNNRAPNDDQGGWQAQILRTSDSAVMWDSGGASGTQTAVNYGAGGGVAQALAYNEQYQALVRTRDSLTNNGAGTWGPYNVPVTFTVRRGATVTIASVTSQGETLTGSPIALGAADIIAHVGYVHPDGNPASGYRVYLYGADQATIRQQSAIYPLNPYVPSGGAFDTVEWRPPMDNHAIYYLVVGVLDSVTGLESLSAPIQMTSNWIAPSTPTLVGIAPDPANGTVTLRWTLPDPTTAWVTVERQRIGKSGNGGPWELLTSGHLWTQLIDFPCPRNVYVYRIAAVGTSGMRSDYLTTPNVMLEGRLRKYAVWLNDPRDPLNVKVAFGELDSYDVTQRSLNKKGVEVIGKGAKLPKAGFSRQSYVTYGSQSWFIRAAATGPNNEVYYGEDVLQTVYDMADRSLPLYYRDPRGRGMYVTIWNYTDKVAEGETGDQVAFEVHQVYYDAPAPVIGS